MGRTLRTFVGLPLGRGVRRKLARLAEGHGDLRGVRWVNEENLHVTIKFLGNTREQELARIGELIRAAAGEVEPFVVDVRGLGAFGSKARPRVIWAGVERGAEALTQLSAGLDEVLAGEGFGAEKRRYVPHVTLARVTSGDGRGISEMVEKGRVGQYGVFDARAITYYSSDLQRGGAVYTVLSTAPLGQGSS